MPIVDSITPSPFGTVSSPTDASTPPSTPMTTRRKALTINLDEKRYGTFAEIGAGQEVARNFFQVGGAAGTIAKSMSAYDMKFSDAIYGVCDRYVSEGRLISMIQHEYQYCQSGYRTVATKPVFLHLPIR